MKFKPSLMPFGNAASMVFANTKIVIDTDFTLFDVSVALSVRMVVPGFALENEWRSTVSVPPSLSNESPENNASDFN